MLVRLTAVNLKVNLQSQGKRPGDEVGLEGNPTVLGHRSRMPKRSLYVAVLLLDVTRRF